MKKQIVGRPLTFALRAIGAWPGCGKLWTRIIIWIFMLVTLWFQFADIADTTDCLRKLMESVALTVTHILSFTKIFVLWKNRSLIEECLEILEEDWKRVTDKSQIAMMARLAKIARYMCMSVIVSYWSSEFTFLAVALSTYTPGDSDTEKREFILRQKHPFNSLSSPIYEMMLVFGMLQGSTVILGNFISDSFLIALIAHISGQLNILHDQILRLTKPSEMPEIVENHKRLIHFAERVRLVFRLIGIAQYLTGSVIICAVGYMVVTRKIVKFISYIIAMTFGVFIYGCAGNILIETSMSISDAAYECNWMDLPLETRKMLILIMMRASKPLTITAGDFVDMNYESFVNIMKAAFSYLSVINASGTE